VNAAEQEIVRRSADPKALVHAAQVLASSDDAADVRVLGDALIDAGFLARLDDDDAYDGTINRLRIARVLRTLVKNLDASRAAILVSLTSDAAFLEQELRIDLLIQACASLRPSPPEVVKFWDAHCQPDDGFANLTIAALIQNASTPALELFVTKLMDPAHDEADKVEWLRQDVLAHRTDVQVLRACWDALARGLGPPLDLMLVQVIFDYRPEEWYRPATVQEPSDATLTPAGVAEMLKIARHAQSYVALDDRTRERVDAFIKDQTP
jgi:hypothetical protein